MSYLLDTNACIALMRYDKPGVRQRYEQALVAGDLLFVSAITLFELEYGIAKSAFRSENMARLQQLLQRPIKLLDLQSEDCVRAADLRASLESQAQPIGPYDMLIAGQALARNLTLVTANTREFARVPNLQWQDWEAPQ